MKSDLLQLAKEKKIIRYSDLISEKIPTVYLNRQVKEGNLIKLGRGIYALPETEFDENQTFLEVSHFVPKGVFCFVVGFKVS